MTAAELRARIHLRYSQDRGYAVLEEVRDGTGFAATRSIDVIAMQTWPSRGLLIEGVELKVSRSDWLRELKNPAKADAIAGYLDLFWVAAPADVVELEELPGPWGLLVPHGRGLKAARQAQRLEPQPLDRIFVASVLRRAVEQLSGQTRIKAARNEGWEAGLQDARRRLQLDGESEEKELERLKAAIAEFEAASGVRLTTWDAGRIGRAVDAVLRNDARARLRQQRDQLHRIVTTMDEALAEMAA